MVLTHINFRVFELSIESNYKICKETLKGQVIIIIINFKTSTAGHRP